NLYVVSGYRSTTWQTEIYNHMVNTYSVAKADQTCSRPGHSEHTTGLACDIALDNYSFEDVIKHPQYQWFLGQLANYGFIIR
ncbi:D-alanyl-D-alanine carboxypeptidase family protein, partial [[Ruminococcus] gnavus]